MPKLLEELAAPNIEVLQREIEHFTQREAEKRDKILLSYFGNESISLIVDFIGNRLLSKPKLNETATILDVGAGSGLFTLKVAKKLWSQQPKAKFYAMDATPILLRMLTKKTSKIIPFIGIAENITKSAKIARRHIQIPEKFDAMFSTLTLHHCPKPEKVFQSMHEAVKARGKIVVVDLCKHPFEEFKTEIRDIHLGFEPEQIKRIAKKFFPEPMIEKLPGICCSSSGRWAELFLAYMTI